MPKIRMLEAGEDPLKMHIEPSGPSMAWVFVIGFVLLACGLGCTGTALVMHLR